MLFFNPKPKNIALLCAIIFFCLSLLTPQCFGEVLNGQAYYDAVRKQLSQAEKTITVVMYFIILEPKGKGVINDLVNDLIQAKQRGVMVKVILENSKLKENRLAYQLLRKQGVAVNFDTAEALLHTKAVVIDDRYVFIGSANWSRAAIQDNYEINNFIDSTQDAAVLNQYISSIQLQDRNVLLPITSGITIPQDFLLSAKFGPQLLKAQADKQFDLYLLLTKIIQDTNQSELKINYDSLAISMGYTPLKNLGKYRDQHNYFYDRIHRLLIKLKRYGLINYQKNIVSLKPAKSSKQIIIPFEYWEYDYPVKLSMRAKYLYLICLQESARSSRYPFWFRSQKHLAKIYHISDTTISLGLQELEKKRIIQINRDKLNPDNFRDRLANVYQMLELPQDI
ncbi:MAG: hypothetical protein KKD05_09670 [Candidatus Omnitrophica bacterium]|nr:hypothetical protein [Candidatus Omnitrophota bacterium]